MNNGIKNYEILSEIQNNRMGKIELVKNLEENKKYIKRTFYEDKREIYYEIQKVASRHIPAIKDIFFGEDTIVIEEYVEGIALRDYMSDQIISVKEFRQIVNQLVEAVEGIHRQNIIHRDIKPENILITKNGTIKLIDFGIARVFREDMERDTEYFGTRGYAAPEQFGYAQSDFRTDIFAIGKTLHFIVQYCEKSNVYQRQIQKCMEFDPSKRYATIGQLKKALKKKGILSFWVLLSFLLLFGITIFVLVLGLKKENSSVKESNIIVKSKQKKVALDIDEKDKFIIKDEKNHICKMIADGASEKLNISGYEGVENLTMEAELNEGKLQVVLKSDHEKVMDQEFNYSLAEPADYTKSYQGTKVDAEILFCDMNGDSQEEIVIALSDRYMGKLLDGSRQKNVNGIALWCIGYQDKMLYSVKDALFMEDLSLEIGNNITQGIFVADTFETIVLKDKKLVLEEG